MAGFDFSTFSTRSTPRLILREVALSDAEDFFRFDSDPEVQKYDSDPPFRELSEATRVIEGMQERFAAKKSINWGVCFKEDNRLIGHIGFYFWGMAYDKADLGYTIARPCWRRGIATEALRALMQFGFGTMRLHRINVDTRMDNLASVRLMQKLGFCHEGVRRECVRNEDGTYQSWDLYGMLEEEYRAISSRGR